MTAPRATALLGACLVLLSCLAREVLAGADSAAEALHRKWHPNANGSEEEQCFRFSLDQSIARDAFAYPDSITGQRKTAEKGDLIHLKCDSVVCPNPPVVDCYMNEDACAPDEWCQLEDQVRFGPWAMAEGETPNVGSGDCAVFKEQGYDWIYDKVCRNTSHWGPWKPVRGRCSPYRQEQQSCNAFFAPVQPAAAPPQKHHHHHHQRARQRTEQQQVAWFDDQQQDQAAVWENEEEPSSLGLTQGDDGQLSRAMAEGRGSSRIGRQLNWVTSFHDSSSRSLKQQQQQQRRRLQEPQTGASAVERHGAAAGGAGLGDGAGIFPQYVVDEEFGRPPVRPMLCAPGLVCTGDVEPLPYTCVKIRPPNTCYQGPWWDSLSWCKVGGATNNKHYGGLPLEELKAAAQALLVQLPVEIFTGPLEPRFWYSKPADAARSKVQKILAALWPERYRSETQFPLDFPDPRKAGALHTAGWNATAAKAQALYRQSSKVWSTVHSLIHNCKDPMPGSQVAASRALAVWLRQHFMCCNCRGMWANYVLNRLGLPPTSSSRLDHTRWWWRAHNMVTEHAASTRGGHPWVWPSLPNEEFAERYKQYGDRLTCQNPWFLPFEFAETMWRIPDAE